MKKLLIIGYTWPEPNSTAAGNRMLQLTRFFQEEDYDIVFASAADETELSLDLEALGIRKKHIKLNHSGFNDFVSALNPDIVLFDRFLTEEQFGWRVAQSVPDALRVLDTEDLHSLRKSRQKALKQEVSFTETQWLQEDMTKREIASIYRSDLSLIISSFEMALLTRAINMDETLLLHLPFMFDSLDSNQVKHYPTFEERVHFICIGNGRHAPNVDALVWLKESLWPSIRKDFSKAELHIYGSYLPQHVYHMHNDAEGFIVKGRAEDPLKTMGKYRINLAPLRFGAGIKGKLTDAMRSGTPSVTTTIGAEGMHDNLPWNGYIADKDTAFAEAAIRLYNDSKAWAAAQHNGIALINKFYHKELIYKFLRKKINGLLEDVTHHRSQNFMGMLLMHQTLNATKYMSKWIEEKNKH